MLGMDIKPRFETEDISAKKFIRTVANHNGKGLSYEKKDTKCGYMVYFPQGHSIHVRTRAELKRLGFDRQAGLIDMESGEEVPVNANRSLKEHVNRKTKPTRGAESGDETLEGLQSEGDE